MSNKPIEKLISFLNNPRFHNIVIIDKVKFHEQRLRCAQKTIEAVGQERTCISDRG